MKRKDKIKEIESLIEKNRCSRRKFIDSLGKTIALSSIAATGWGFVVSCDKMDSVYENKGDLRYIGDCNKMPHNCYSRFECSGGSYICMTPFSCSVENICTSIMCELGKDYGCTKQISHKGGRGY